MILKNPLKNEVTIGILGTEYSIKAEGTIEVPDLIGINWKKVHGFLQIVNEVEKEKEEKEPEVVITTTESNGTLTVDMETGNMTTGTKEEKEIKVTRKGTKK